MSQWLKWAERIQELSQAGLTLTQDESDRERYAELQQIAREMSERQEELPSEQRMPKLEVRGVIFNGDRIMLVKDHTEERWALPGAYCEASLSPAEHIIEVIEDVSGLDVVPVRLLALFDSRQHPHMTGSEHTYKLFIECALLGEGETSSKGAEELNFFDREELPDLSLTQNTVEQLHMCFDAHWQENDWTTLFD